MGVVLMFNKQRLDNKGLVCTVDTSGNAYSFFDIVESAKTTDAEGSISVNGERVLDACFTLDMNNRSATLATSDMLCSIPDLDKVRVEINIYGNIHGDENICGET